MNGTKILLFPQFFHIYNWCKNQTYNYFPTVCFYTPELRVHNTVHTKQCMNANGISKIATYLFENILCCHFFFFCVCDILRLYARLMKKKAVIQENKNQEIDLYILLLFPCIEGIYFWNWLTNWLNVCPILVKGQVFWSNNLRNSYQRDALVQQDALVRQSVIILALLNKFISEYRGNNTNSGENSFGGISKDKKEIP